MHDHVRRANNGGWVPTSIHHQIVETVEFAVGLGATATITGRPGIGKSTALRRINQSDQKAIMIEFSPRFRTMKGLHKAFLEALGYPDHFRSGYDTEQTADEEARSAAINERYLMIDEFQNFDLEAIRGILRFNDNFRLPIILIGNLARMRRIKVDTHTFEQISDRIWNKVTLDDPGREDMLAFAAAYDVEGPEAWDTLAEIGLRTTIRHLVHVLETARMARGAGSLKSDHLREAETFISGAAQPKRSRS